MWNFYFWGKSVFCSLYMINMFLIEVNFFGENVNMVEDVIVIFIFKNFELIFGKVLVKNIYEEVIGI